MPGKASKAQRETVAQEAVVAALASASNMLDFERPGLGRIISAAQKRGYKRGAVPVEKGMDVVFVYGTLQPGWLLHERIGEHVVAYEPLAKLPEYRMYANFYPWIIHKRGEEGVWGTLLYLKDASAAIDTMDRVELGAGYERVRVEVQTPDGPVSAWVYVWNQGYIPWREDFFVPSGDFAEFDEEGEWGDDSGEDWDDG